MMKSAIIAAVFSASFSTAAVAGPFGLKMGQSVVTVSGKPSSVDNVYRIQVPQPNVEFESYSAVATPATGICKAWGIGRDHTNDRYGNEVQSAYERLKEILTSKYGESHEISFIRSGALWKDANEWVMSIKQQERTHVAYWSNEKSPLPDGLVTISLEVKALSSDTAYLDLTYEFENFTKCQATMKAKTAEGL